MSDSKSSWEEELEAILDGIDRYDSENGGWWETSAGVNLGIQKQNEIKDLIRKLLGEPYDDRISRP
jgi:hypothetical protein